MQNKSTCAMLIAFILSYICVASIAAAMVTPAMPQMAQYFHVTQNQIGSVVSLFLVGYVIGQLIYGPLANRLGINLALQIGLMIGVAGVMISIVASLYHCYTLFLLGRVICALGTASGLSCTFMILHDQLTDVEVKHAAAYSALAFTFGIGLAVLLGGIITQYFDWLATFWCLLAYLSFMLAATLFLPRCKKIENQQGFIANIGGLVHALRNIKLWIFACTVGLCSAVGYVYSAAGPLIAQQQLGLSASGYGYWNCINMLGMLISGVTGAYLLKRLSALIVITLSIIFILLSLITLALLNHFTLVSAATFFAITSLLYLFGGWCFPAGASLAMQTINNKAHAASAKSFINMGSATLAVFIFNGIHASRLNTFVLVLASFAIVLSVFLISHRKAANNYEKI